MIPSVRIAKRILDLGASVVGVILTLPLYPVIAAAIYLESPGPILYRQRRAGQLIGPDGDSGRFRFVEFVMVKFRTMRPDAERLTGPVLAAEKDPRVTRVGGFLRKTRLDELPQFWNVLRGDMSLVGPRPERPELLANLSLAIPFFEERMRNVKPGITGLAQTSLGYTGRAPDGSDINSFKSTLTNPFKLEGADDSEADDMRMKMMFDLAYSASLEDFKSFLALELSIILKTPLVMIRGVGH